jgi:hypothetical protein
MMKLAFALTYFISRLHANQLAPIIEEAGKQYRQDPYMISAVIRVESIFSKNACYRGAYGYMQVQTRYSRCTYQAFLHAGWLDLLSTRKNIFRGTRLMMWWRNYCKKHHRGKGHHWLLHYNQGFGKCPPGKPRCRRHERIPITTGKIGGYADRVLHFYRILKDKASRAYSS